MYYSYSLLIVRMKYNVFTLLPMNTLLSDFSVASSFVCCIHIHMRL